jgi:hypothetical protein
MSVRIETLGVRNRTPQVAWLALIAAILVVVATLALLKTGGSTAGNVPIRTPAVTASVDSVPDGLASKAVATDPFVRNQSAKATGPATATTFDQPRFGPNFNMGKQCPKCW